MTLQVPDWTIDGMRFPGRHEVDNKGREWTILRDGETGWQGSPAVRSDRTQRPMGHGSMRSANWRQERILTLKGRVWCPDADSREETERELAALCSSPRTLYEYRRTTSRFDQVVYVELDDEVLIQMPNGTGGIECLEYSFQFAAPDPRIHDFVWQQPFTNVPTSAVDGLDFFTNLDFSGPGLDFGYDDPTYGITKVANYGTAPAYPLFRLRGPMSFPTIHCQETGATLEIRGNIEASETVWINCDKVVQRGIPGHGVESSERGNVRSMLYNWEWPHVAGGNVATFQLDSAGSSEAEMMTLLRSAYW